MLGGLLICFTVISLSVIDVQFAADRSALPTLLAVHFSRLPVVVSRLALLSGTFLTVALLSVFALAFPGRNLPAIVFGARRAVRLLFALLRVPGLFRRALLKVIVSVACSTVAVATTTAAFLAISAFTTLPGLAPALGCVG